MFFEFPPQFLSKKAAVTRTVGFEEEFTVPYRNLTYAFSQNEEFGGALHSFSEPKSNTPIAYVTLRRSVKGPLHVTSMYVHPDYRGRGLGKDLFGFVQDIHDGETIQAKPDPITDKPHNKATLGKIYEAYGFRKSRTHANLYYMHTPFYKKADYAPGIPDRNNLVPLPDVKKPLTWKMSLQEHHADRAGHHYDLRLIDPDTGHAHSWALPKAQMPEPGKSVLAVQQPTHTSEYALNFGKDKEQEITKGYGKGRVKIKALEEVEVYHSKPEATGTRVRFNRYSSKGPEEYAIVRTSSGQDLLVNKTLARHRLPHLDLGSKPKLREGDIDAINLSNDSEVMMPKYDGAHTLLDLKTEDRIPRLFSYRLPKRHTAGVIEHTHKVPSLLTTRVPKELRGTVLRTETIGVDAKGRAVPAKDIAGMLNATVPNSRAKQQEFKAHLVPVILDVEKYKGKSVQHLPFKERYELARDIGKQLNMPVTDAAFSSDAKQKLLTRIRAGKHPMTTEGVVLRPLNTDGLATKAKIRPDHDVHVRRIFEAVNKDGEGTGRAGGFEYSWTPRGPVVGRIGTGLDHAMAREMLRNPENYVGRVAKVTAEQRYSSGALGKPSFREWHLDK